MNVKGREVIGTCKGEMLIADSSMGVDVATVILSKTDEIINLRRGSVLAVSNADGKCRLLNGAEGESAAYILAEDISTSATEEVVAEVYRTGKFARNSLIVAENYTLSVGDERVLRDAGIYLESAMV
ncbi:MAG: head decoration protein [Ruminococcus sp.]|nr:head decoration protein [Ruminococcus sp.]